MLLINGGIGFWQEKSASMRLDALKRQLALKARVRRDGRGRKSTRPAGSGRHLRLRLGDVVPADIKLLEGDYLSIDQAALTGESLPVTKKAGDGGLFRQGGQAGRDGAVVYATGGNTFFGRTAKLVRAPAPSSISRRP